MTLSKEELHLFANTSLNTFNIEDLSLQQELVLNFLSKEILSNYTDLNSISAKKARFERFNIKGSSPEDYSERLIELSNGKKVICGIRHQSLNRDLPFVNCIPDFKIESESDALTLYSEIEKYFAVFKPLNICLWTKNKLNCNFIGSIYMVSPSQKIRDNYKWKNEKNIVLEKISNDSYYPWLEKGYERFHDLYPELRWKVSVNSKETMQESIDQDLLYCALKDGQRIGLIAAVRSDFLGHPGFYFNEIFIDEAWKGKGLAKIIQQIFIAEQTNDEIVWGTIDSANIPSYKTAAANGRIPIRFESFFKVKK